MRKSNLSLGFFCYTPPPTQEAATAIKLRESSCETARIKKIFVFTLWQLLLLEEILMVFAQILYVLFSNVSNILHHNQSRKITKEKKRNKQQKHPEVSYVTIFWNLSHFWNSSLPSELEFHVENHEIIYIFWNFSGMRVSKTWIFHIRAWTQRFEFQKWSYNYYVLILVI